MTDTDASKYYDEDIIHTSFHVGERDSEGFWCTATFTDFNEAYNHCTLLSAEQPTKTWQIVRQTITNSICLQP